MSGRNDRNWRTIQQMKKIKFKRPSIKFHIPQRVKTAFSMLLMLVTYIFATFGAVGLAITLIHPTELWWSIAPIETRYFLITYSSVLYYLDWLQIYYWESVSTFSTLLVLAYAIHIRSIKQLWSIIKASPKALLYSPISFYKEVKLFRDWLFNKIEYLNAESAKWHKFFMVMKSPYSLLRSMGVNPQMAIAILGIGSTTAVGVGVAEVIEQRSFANGDSGIYLAPENVPSEELERELAWRKDNPSDNTLRVILNETPVEKLSISSVNIGTSYASNGEPSALPENKTEAILIDGNGTRIEVGKLTFSRNSCKTLALSDINANKITIKDNQADGLSIYQSATSTQPNLRVSGGNYMADLLETKGGTYDRLWIAPLDTMTSSKTKVNEIILDNIVSSGGTCDLKKLDIGELIIQFNRIGGDSNLVTKAFTVTTTVKSANWDVLGNIEVVMAEVARQPD
jgi:hypothetical protein